MSYTSVNYCDILFIFAGLRALMNGMKDEMRRAKTDISSVAKEVSGMTFVHQDEEH